MGKRLWINELLALVFLFPTKDKDGIKDMIKSKRERKALKQSRINGIRNVSFSITQNLLHKLLTYFAARLTILSNAALVALRSLFSSRGDYRQRVFD